MTDRPRIDQTIYADGSVECRVVMPGRGIVYRTRRYRKEDRDGTVPGMRALRAAQDRIASGKLRRRS